MHRMQSFNISFDESPPPPVYQEQWLMEEICDANADEWMAEMCVNAEHELYFKGYTAVWTKGLPTENAVLPRTCFTCDTPIEHAFFCQPEFVREKELGPSATKTKIMTSPLKHKSPQKSPQKKTTTTASSLDDIKKGSMEEIPGICLIGLLWMMV